MNTFEQIREEIVQAQEALSEARDALLRVRHARETEHIVAALRRAGDHVARAVERCERILQGIV